ncbi:hypothetical protein Tco_0496992 [Tanacetum coccineum]
MFTSSKGVSAIRDEEDHNLEVKYKNRKIIYDKYVRALNPQCRRHPEKITVVDTISRKGLLEFKKCVSTKKSKQAQVILENIKVRTNELRRIEQILGIIPRVPLSEFDPMIEFHDLMNKRKLDEKEMEGSFFAGMDCDLSLPFELENKKHVDGQVVYELEYGMLFRNSYMHRCFIRVKDLCKCSLERLYLIKGMYYHTHTDSSATSIEKEFTREICNMSSQNANVLNDITNISQSGRSIQWISQNTASRPGRGRRRLGDSTRTHTVNRTPIRSRGVCDSAVNLSTSQTYPSFYSLSQLSESTISVVDPFLDTQARGRGRRQSYNDTSLSVRRNLNPVGTQSNGNIEWLTNHSVICENVSTPLSQIPRTHISSRTIVHQNGTSVHSSNLISSTHSGIGCLTYSSTHLDSIPVSSDCVLSVTPQSSVSLSSSRSDALDNGTPVNLSNMSSITQSNRTRSRQSSIRAMSSSQLSNSNISDVDTNTTRSIDYHRCQHCQAVLWYEERSVKWYNPHNPKFAVCCGDGKVKLDYIREPPALLTALCDYNGGQRSKIFRKHIKLINFMFAFTSTGGRINKDINDGHGPYTFCINGHNHHRIGTLLPTHVDGRHRFAQLYIYDTANETENRFYALNHHLSNNSKDATLRSLVQQLISMLDSNNVLVKAFIMAKERFSDSSRQPVSIRLLGSKRRDQRQYNLPTISEVAALIPGDGNPTDCRDVLIEERSIYNV